MIEWRSLASDPGSLVPEAVPLPLYSVPLSAELKGVLGWERSWAPPRVAGQDRLAPMQVCTGHWYEANDHVLETCFIIARLCSPNSKYCRRSEEGKLRAGSVMEELKFELDF